MSANFAAALPFAVLAACLCRARLLALALIPPCALILARSLELIDTSSASHPLRWIVPVSCASLSGMAAWWYSQKRFYDVVVGHRRWESVASVAPNHRTLVASLLVLGSCAPDLLALHPFFWARFAEWPLAPVQIAVCGTILAVLLAPERWIVKCLR